MPTSVRYLPPVSRGIHLDPYDTHGLTRPMSDAELTMVLNNITYKMDWNIEPRRGAIRIWHPAIDTRPPHPSTVVEAEFATDWKSAGQIIDTVGQGICDMEDHEFKEWFRFMGRCVLEPHPELHHA